MSLRNGLFQLPNSPVSLAQFVLAFAVMATLSRARGRIGPSTFLIRVDHSHPTIGGPGAIGGYFGDSTAAWLLSKRFRRRLRPAFTARLTTRLSALERGRFHVALSGPNP